MRTLNTLVGFIAAAVCAMQAAATVEPVSPSKASASDRALAMLVGAFVADAATMPLHWIYSVSKIQELVGSGNPEFFSPPSCPYYNYTEGGFSPYGQQSTVYFEQLATLGAVNASAIANAYYAFYTTGDCGTESNCYQDGSTQGFLQNMKQGIQWPNCGANDAQADAIVHSLPVIALYAGHPDMLSHVQTVTRITQNTDKAVAFASAAARILEKVVVNGTSGYDAVHTTIAELYDSNRSFPTTYDSELALGLQKVMAQLSWKNIDVCLEIGQSCDWPNNLWTGSHLIAQGADYLNATRQTIMAGGDQCSRTMFVQGFNAALGGMSVIPSGWPAKVTQYQEMYKWAQQIVNHRSSIHQDA
eukprot:m.34581 g.34581  ORF g.34581 m.34581 type:complete len:359 (-) comp9780_c0_seq2:399-1475(-)